MSKRLEGDPKIAVSHSRNRTMERWIYLGSWWVGRVLCCFVYSGTEYFSFDMQWLGWDYPQWRLGCLAGGQEMKPDRPLILLWISIKLPPVPWCYDPLNDIFENYNSPPLFHNDAKHLSTARRKPTVYPTESLWYAQSDCHCPAYTSSHSLER